ncbi:MAG TPA: hypothetical protein VFH69_00655 [Gemmatimonadota bacterium]|nr:hypothetical protein [Gemmatimonadota bacterium]
MPEGSSERPAGSESGEIATSTLAEIYAQQGLLGRALSIYRRMLSRTPEDREISGRIENLERRIAETGPTSEDRIAEIEQRRAVARERLPWDPPEEPEGGEPEENGPSPPPEASTATPPMGPIDSRAFEVWLEGR